MLDKLCLVGQQAEDYLKLPANRRGSASGSSGSSKLVSVLGMPQHRFASIHVVGHQRQVLGGRDHGPAARGARDQRGCLPLTPRRTLARARPDPRRRDHPGGVRRRGRARRPGRADGRPQSGARRVGDPVRGRHGGGLRRPRRGPGRRGGDRGRPRRAARRHQRLPSRVTVLTSVGLEHTEYLGDTEVEIATEKLAVLRDHTTLVLGPVSPTSRSSRGARPPPTARG